MGRDKELDEARQKFLDELQKKREQDSKSETERYRKELEAKRNIELANDSAERQKAHITRKDDKGNPTATTWDEVDQLARNAITGENPRYGNRADFGLIMALAKAVTVSFNQTLDDFKVQATLQRLVYDIKDLGVKNALQRLITGTFDPNNVNVPIKPGLDVPQYNVHFKEGKLEIDPLTIHGMPITGAHEKPLNEQFNVMVRLWMYENGYEPSPDPQSKGVYVNISDPTMILTEDKFNELNAPGAESSLAEFLKLKTGLQCEELPREEPVQGPRI